MNNQDMKMIHGNSMAFVDELVDTVLFIKERYKLDEQTAVEILKMKVLCESLNGIERVLQEIYNTI
ncbi:hypothetical protein KJW53_02720 [Streptococcus macedonicus]|uniref:hypothetical protein n=1 Tax=Streptococcus macedonicus TaxID=59310 RepID=UPI001BDDBCC0|nr:hypothetical protein [Streptococcus macedonicus]MBT1047806.1 hypothetical protein [Streptococcus macedonicus]